MNPEKNEPQLDRVESSVERGNEPKTFLDGIRKWAHSRVLVAGFVAGTSLSAAACDAPEGDKTEQVNNNNQNEIYEGCEPFSMCMTTGLYDEETSERIGFSFWYKVPDGQEFENATVEILDLNDNVVGEEDFDFFSGTGEFWVTVPGYDGDFETPQAPTAGAIRVKLQSGEIVLIRNGELIHPDDDGPSIGH